MSNKIILTKEGYNKLQEELRHLKEVKRPKALERLKKAREMGDLTENSEYGDAKEGLSLIDKRIQEIEEILKNGEIIEKNSNRQVVDIGSEVIIETEGRKENFIIVGEGEADPVNKKLSHTSPIGRALMGKKAGERVEIEAPGGKVVYKIIKVK
jgi:transcription elongation factor GreA